MGKTESLMHVREIWDNQNLTVFDKASDISAEYYTANLELASTAAYIGATPSELDALLSLSELDDDVLKKVSESNPPITTWMILASASDDEILAAVEELKDASQKRLTDNLESVEERLYTVMVQVAGPTPEQSLASIPCDVLLAMSKRAKDYKALSEKEINFLSSAGNYRRAGKILTNKQVKWVKDILSRLADAEVIKHNGIDSDQAMCDAALDALGR